MKKILIITLEFPPTVGGIASYISQFAASFPSEKMVVLAPTQANASDWDKKQQYKIIRKNPYFPRILWPRWIRLFLEARKIVKKEGIETIHIHHILPVGYVAWLLRKIYRVPFLVFSHGTDLLLSTRTPWKRHMVSVVANAAEQLIFNSESLMRRFVEIAPAYRGISRILYPCPSPIFLNRPHEQILESLRSRYALNGKRVMLSVSRLGEGKGFPHLLRLLPEILKQEPNLVWLIVGDGPKRELLITEMQKQHLQNVVRFVGSTPHEELSPYYYLADVFVLLTHPDETRGEEGLGLVFLEAAAAGLPIVAGKSGGVEEAVLNGTTGLVIDIHQRPDSIVQAVVELVHNKQYAKRLGEAGRERIIAQFQWEHQLNQIREWL